MIKMTIALGLSFSLLLFQSCSDNAAKQTENSNEISSTFISMVKIVDAVLSSQQEELILNGKVEYDPDKVISYVPLVNGTIDRTYFSLGDKVQKGESLLDIRSSDLSSLQQEYIQYDSEHKVAERDMATASAMFEDNMISEKEYLEVQSQLRQTESSLNKVKSDLYLYRYNNNGTFSIKSPMSGYVVGKKASSGSPVSPDSDPIFIIADLSSVWIIANVYASNVQFVKEGMDVDITTLSYPGEVFSAKIVRVSQIFDSEEKVLKARIVLPNADLKLKPEMSAVIKLKNNSDEKAVTIPTSALVFDKNTNFVVVEDSDGEFQAREVEIKGKNGETTYIESGLMEGEKVVVSNQLLIYSALNDK